MAWIQRLWMTFFGDSRERRIEEELAYHVEERTAENIAAGMDPVAARLDARRRFGPRARLEEETRDVRVLEPVDTLLRDIRLAWRSIRRRPGMAATIILSLAIGIGANSAIFSVVDGVLLRPYHIANPERVFSIEESRHGVSHNGTPRRVADWTRTSSIAAVCGFYEEGLTMTGQGAAERVRTWRTIGDPLALLGVQPVLGRGFTLRELAGLEPVALLDHAFWSRRFGSDEHMLGKALTLGGRDFTVVGILPEGLDYPGETDVVIPAPADLQQAGRRASFLSQVARLKDGASVGAVQAELDTIARRLRQQYPDTDSGLQAQLKPLRVSATQEARKPLLILMTTVGFVLLMACVNTASLLLSRSSERSRESAVRLALGAGPGSLIRIYLVESLVLAACGGVLGIALASLSLQALISILPPELPRLGAIHLDLRVAGISLAASLLCGLLFGLFPAIQAARSARQSSLGHGVRLTTGGHRLWSRRLLVVGQIALSAILLVGVGLLGKSLFFMLRAPLGFAQTRVTTVRVSLPWDTDAGKLRQFYASTLEALAGVPGVRAVGVIDRLPLEGGTQSGRIALRGLTLGPDLAARSISYRGTSPGYFTVLGIPLKAGRLLNDRRSDAAPREIVVNETLAHQFFSDGRAAGHYITFDVDPGLRRNAVWYQIVGVVGDVRGEPSQIAPMPEAFLLMRDVYWPMANFVLRTDGNVDAAIRTAMARTNPDQVLRISALERELNAAVREPQVRVWLLSGFALTALLLASIGLYGLLASDVALRTQEIGIRMALGADAQFIVKRTVLQAFELVASGLVLGVLGALALTRYLSSLLYLVTNRDAMTFAAAAMTLLIVACLAAYLPARRAAGISPLLALRHE